jgi:chitinase
VNTPDTRRAFSNMAASASSRQTFIDSLIAFMKTWGFDGVDLDWEYPGADDRGGTKVDTANLVKLLQQMRSAFGSTYEITVTLPASYWYLRWFDLRNMEQYLDWFNVMYCSISVKRESSLLMCIP